MITDDVMQQNELIGLVVGGGLVALIALVAASVFTVQQQTIAGELRDERLVQIGDIGVATRGNRRVDLGVEAIFRPNRAAWTQSCGGRPPRCVL